MTRRQRGDDQQFGSDSFLDIVANIVGILIILIVIAGVRVSQTPPTEQVAESTQKTEPTTVEIPEEAVSDNLHRANLAAQFAVGLAEESAEIEKEENELRERARRLQKEIADSESKGRSLRARSDALVQTASTKKLEGQQAILSALQQVVDESRVGLDEDRRQLDEEKKSLADIRRRFEEIESEGTPRKTLKHHVSPVSKLVEGTEHHFRLSGNRVAYVPLDTMLEQIKREVERQKSWLIKMNRHEGSIGPLRGFEMDYIVERQKMSALEELRYGQSMLRIILSEWQIYPTDEMEALTVREAIQPGTEFARLLQTARPGTTITMWVYPDSFALFRQMQQLAHRRGLTVAARPLPFDVPIAGSEHGSRSAGQ